MHVVCGATFAVAGVYYVWRAYAEVLERRRQRLCRRMAYMLWVMAQTGGTGPGPLVRLPVARGELITTPEDQITSQMVNNLGEKARSELTGGDW